MAHANTVVHSFNLDGGMRCVDVFARPDGTFGFEEYRRDAEDGRGWFPVGFHSATKFASSTEALAEARKRVPWLTD